MSAAAALTAQRPNRWADQMSFIDVLIPLAGAVALIGKPTVFLDKKAPPEKLAARSATLRQCGVVLLVVAGVYAVLWLQR